MPRIICRLLFVFFLLSPTAQSTADGPAEPVKVTATAGKIDADGKQVVTVTFEVHEDWYVYANPVRLEEFEDAATLIRVTGKTKLQDVKVAYPAGKPKDDTYNSKKVTYNVYQSKVEIPVTVLRAAGDDGPLGVTVLFQRCTKGKCVPVKLELSVP